METEIKLLLPPGARAAVERHPAFAAAPPRRVDQRSTYYDTPDLALRARGVALRVRRAGEGWVQTVKAAVPAGGILSRGEWEWPVGAEALDPAALEGEPEAWALVGPDFPRLGPVFTTAVVRDLRTLMLEGGARVEAALDSGEVRAGERRAPLEELEIELKAGPVRPMLLFAAEVAEAAGLRLGPESKGERGYALLDATPPRPSAADPALPGGVTLARAFPALAAAAARDLAADLAAAGRGDVEGVHRLRAAIRRARTLLALFRPHLAREAASRFDGALRDFGRVLGAGRDWDVFLTETIAAAEGEVGAEAAAALRAAATARRAEAQAAVARVVEGPAPTQLLLGLAEWTADDGWMGPGAPGGARLRALLPALLDRLERRARERGRHLRSLDADELHALRKSLKKLRYACEDVASLYGGEAPRRYVGRVRKVLADLGAINDGAVAEERAAEIAAAGDLAGPAAALLRWIEGRRPGRARELRRRWRAFRRADPFWG